MEIDPEPSVKEIEYKFKQLEIASIQAAQLRDDYCKKIYTAILGSRKRSSGGLDIQFIEWLANLPVKGHSALTAAFDGIHPYLKGYAEMSDKVRGNALVSAAMGKVTLLSDMKEMDDYERDKIAKFLCRVLTHVIIPAILSDQSVLKFIVDENGRPTKETRNVFRIDLLPGEIIDMIGKYSFYYAPKLALRLGLDNKLFYEKLLLSPSSMMYRLIGKMLYNFAIVFSHPIKKDEAGIPLYDVYHRAGYCMDVYFKPKGYASEGDKRLRIRWTKKGGDVGCLIGMSPESVPKHDELPKNYFVYKLYQWMKAMLPVSEMKTKGMQNFRQTHKVAPFQNPFLNLNMRSYKNYSEEQIQEMRGGETRPVYEIPTPFVSTRHNPEDVAYNYKTEYGLYLRMDVCNPLDVIQKLFEFKGYDMKNHSMTVSFKLVSYRSANELKILLGIDPEEDTHSHERKETLFGKMFKITDRGTDITVQESSYRDAFDTIGNDAEDEGENKVYWRPFYRFLRSAEAANRRRAITVEASIKRLARKYSRYTTGSELPWAYKNLLYLEVGEEETRQVLKTFAAHSEDTAIMRDMRVNSINVRIDEDETYPTVHAENED